MQADSNDDERLQVPSEQPRKPYKPPDLVDFGTVTEQTQSNRRHAASMDRGSS